MTATEKLGVIKKAKKAVERYTKILEKAGLNQKEAEAMANEVFSPFIDTEEPKTAK